jgi:hypothetical protein
MINYEKKLIMKKRSNKFDIYSKSYFRSDQFDDFKEREFKILMN